MKNIPIFQILFSNDPHPFISTGTFIFETPKKKIFLFSYFCNHNYYDFYIYKYFLLLK